MLLNIYCHDAESDNNIARDTVTTLKTDDKQYAVSVFQEPAVAHSVWTTPADQLPITQPHSRQCAVRW